MTMGSRNSDPPIYDMKEISMSQQSDYTMSSKDDYPATPVSVTSPTRRHANRSSISIPATLETARVEDKDPSDIQGTWKHLFAFTRSSHLWPLLAAVFATLIAAGLKTVLAFFLGKTFDVMAGYGSGEVNGPDTLSRMVFWAFVLLGIGAANWLSNSIFLALWIIFGELQANSARQDIFDTLLRKNMGWFDSQEQGISSLLSRIQTQTRELQLATSQVFGLLLSDLVTAIASLGLAFAFSWKLTLLLLATMPISAVILSLGTRKLQPAIMAQRKEIAGASQLMTASITAIDLVKVFGGYDQELFQYYRATSGAAKQYITQAGCNSFQVAYVSFWVVAMFCIGFIFGVFLIEKDGISPGAVVTTFYATLACIQGIEALTPHWLVMAKGMSAGAFLSTLTANLRGSRRIKRMTGSIKPEQCRGEVELVDVSFAYPSKPDTKVLSSSSLYFPAGAMTFIIGRSGSGKSTLGSLIANFYEPSTGDIFIDGHSIKILDQDWLQSNVTLIQQTSNLFNESFMMNVALGSRHPNHVAPDEVLRACEMACLDSTIAGLPEGLDTKLGTGAHNLSGGQKQRLALARARLRDPAILILDEVTSGLDQVSRTTIMAALRQWRRGKTTIIITHDITQIDDDDFVYAMDKTRAVEKGHRRDLMEIENGLFAHMAESGMTEAEMKTPIEIIIQSPSTIGSRTSRSELQRQPSDSYSRGFWAGNALVPGQPGSSQRSSLIFAADFALGFNNDQNSNFVSYEACGADQTAPTPRPITVYGRRNDIEIERKRFSRFVSDSFSLGSEYSQQNVGMVSLPSRRLSVLKRASQRVSWVAPPALTIVPPDTHQAWPLPETEQTQYAEDSVSQDALDNEEQSKKERDHASLTVIIKTVWPVLSLKGRLMFICSMCLSVMGGAAMPAFSYCFARLIEVMWADGNRMEKGKMWALYILIIAFCDGGGIGSGRYLAERVAQLWIDAIRMEALKRILRQPKTWFDKKENSPGRLVETLDRNAEEMRNIVGKFIPIVTTVVVMVFGAIIWAMAVSWKLTLVSLSPLPVIAMAVQGYSIVSGKWEERCNKSAEESSATLAEIMLNIRVVRALTLEDFFGTKYRAAASSTLTTGFRRAWWSSPLFGMYNSLSYAMIALVFYYGILLMTKQELSVSQVLQVVNLLMFCIGTATGLLGAIPQLVMAQATAAKLLGYAKLPMAAEGDSGPQSKQLDDLMPVDLSDLCFSYEEGKTQILKGVTLRILPAQCTAIVGPSGCGKSTVLSLLLGLYSPGTSHSDHYPPLAFGGRPASEIDPSHLRSKIAYVSQTPFLFPASIADNIAYGIPESSPSRQIHVIARAASAAGLHDYISSLPDGYNTIVGEGGQTLSGGQSQRLNIARALIRRPRLLIMDEPTSALDAESAEHVRHTIRDMIQRGRSRGQEQPMAIVMVTHSREMMKEADRIIVMEEGRVVEEGTYLALWARGGNFRHLISGGSEGQL